MRAVAACHAQLTKSCESGRQRLWWFSIVVGCQELPAHASLGVLVADGAARLPAPPAATVSPTHVNPFEIERLYRLNRSRLLCSSVWCVVSQVCVWCGQGGAGGSGQPFADLPPASPQTPPVSGSERPSRLAKPSGCWVATGSSTSTSLRQPASSSRPPLRRRLLIGTEGSRRWLGHGISPFRAPAAATAGSTTPSSAPPARLSHEPHSGE